MNPRNTDEFQEQRWENEGGLPVPETTGRQSLCYTYPRANGGRERQRAEPPIAARNQFGPVPTPYECGPECTDDDYDDSEQARLMRGSPQVERPTESGSARQYSHPDHDGGSSRAYTRAEETFRRDFDARSASHTPYDARSRLTESGDRNVDPSRFGRGPKGYTRSDDRIKEDICDRMMAATHFDVDEIEVDVVQGEVTLNGLVACRMDKLEAEQLAAGVLGVIDVVNQIRVRRPDEGVFPPTRIRSF